MERRRPQASPTAAPSCSGAAGETKTQASALVQGPGPPSFFPATKEAPPSLQTVARGSQIPEEAHSPAESDSVSPGWRRSPGGTQHQNTDSRAPFTE